MTFRDIEKKFVIINDPKFVMLMGKESNANSILCYVYVDYQAGLTYQALASTIYRDGDFAIKSRTVGDGQHGTARFATKQEIKATYQHISFTPVS